MNSPHSRGQVLHHLTERAVKRGTAPDQHIIMTGLQRTDAGQSHHFAQAASDAVTLDGIADLPRYGEPDANRVIIGTATRLQHESRRRRSHRAGGCPKIHPALQPLHGT